MVRSRFGVVFVALASGVSVLAGCAAVLEEAQRSSVPVIAAPGPIDLVPAWSLAGARLAPALGGLGSPMPQAAGGFLTFMRPSALTARDSDLFVVDSGRNLLLRIDVFTQTASSLPATQMALAGPVHLAAHADRSLLLIDSARRVHWLAADGRPLPALQAPIADLGQPVDVAVDDARARILVADGLYRQVLEFAPAGRAWSVIRPVDDGGAAITGISALAVDSRGVYLADPACRCIVLMHPGGRVLGRFGAADLTQPVAMAAEGGRLFVADAGTREVRVFVDGKLTQRFAYRSLGVTEIADLKLETGTMYIAAGADARVLAFRVVTKPAGAAR